MLVAGMAAHTELGKAHEIANQVRRIHKDLKDAQNDATKFNNRERLFGLPVTNVRISVQTWLIKITVCVIFRLVSPWTKFLVQ